MLSTNAERAAAALVSQGPMHRADLARRLSVSRTTVTNLVSSLMEADLLKEEPGVELKAKLYATPSFGVLVSVVFFVSETVLVVGRVDGEVLRVDRVGEDVESPGRHRLQGALSLLRGALDGLGGPPVRACHVAVNTQVDVRTGEVLGGEASSMWADVNPRQSLLEVLPEVPVLLENTARLMGLVEQLGEEEPARSLVYVHLSYGVAMGQVVLGEIIQGSRGGAGELGHVSIEPDGVPCSCANRGCLMNYVGERAVLARAAAILGPAATVGDLVDAALEGSHPCRSLISDVGAALGTALVGVANLVDPDMVVVGGELARAGELLTAPVAQVIQARALPLVARGLRVRTAEGSRDPEAVAGAGIHILRQDVQLVERIVRDVLG